MIKLSKQELVLAQDSRPEGYLDTVLALAEEINGDSVILTNDNYIGLRDEYEEFREKQKSDLKEQLSFLNNKKLPEPILLPEFKSDIPVNYGFDQFRSKIYSENGEDGIIFELKNRLKLEWNDCWFCEVDAFGNKFSLNTFASYVCGAKLLYIEANPIKFRVIKEQIKGKSGIYVVGSDLLLNNGDSIDLILEDCIVSNLDLISISAGSNGMALWKSVKNFHPKVVIVRYSDDSNAIRRLIRDGIFLGYDFLIYEGDSAFFVRDDLAYYIE